jgi:hypothetical protein
MFGTGRIGSVGSIRGTREFEEKDRGGIGHVRLYEERERGRER